MPIPDQDFFKRISRDVRWGEGERSGEPLGESATSGVPRSGEEAFILARTTQEIGDGFYRLEQVILANTDIDPLFKWRHSDALRDFTCPLNEAMEINQRRKIPNGTLVYVVPMGQSDDAQATGYTRKSKWVFNYADRPAGFFGAIYFESDGSKKLLINKGTVRVQDDSKTINSKTVSLDFKNLTDCTAGAQSATKTWYWVEVDITYSKSLFWDFDINTSIQSGSSEPDEWVKHGSSQLTSITWSIIIGFVQNEHWVQKAIGDQQHPGFVVWNLISGWDETERQVLVQDGGDVEWEQECCESAAEPPSEPESDSTSKSESEPESESASSSLPCAAICVTDAGVEGANGTYDNTTFGDSNCHWENHLQNAYQIIKNGDRYELFFFDIIEGDIILYQSAEFDPDTCPCPDTLGWETVDIDFRPAPFVALGECGSASASEGSASVTDPCQFVCVEGSNIEDFNGTYALTATEPTCEWKKEDDPTYKITFVPGAAENVYVIFQGGEAVYATEVGSGVEICDCPSDFTYILFQGGAGTPPTVNQGRCDDDPSDSTSASLSMPPCESICVEGAGSADINGTYTLTIDDCEWIRDNSSGNIKIVRNGNYYQLKQGAAVMYTSETFETGTCPCPSEVAPWLSSAGQSPAPTISEDVCSVSADEASPSMQESPQPCDTLCVTNAGDDRYNGQYEFDEENCIWNHEDGGNITIQRNGNQFMFFDTSVAGYLSDFFTVGDCPCPADFNWTTQGSDAPVPVVVADECSSPSPPPPEPMGTQFGANERSSGPNDSDYWTVADAAHIAAPATSFFISVWAKYHTNDLNLNPIIDKTDQNYSLKFTGNTNPAILFFVGTEDDSTFSIDTQGIGLTLQRDEWIHIVAEWVTTNAHMKLWVNGVLEKDEDVGFGQSSEPENDAVPLKFGAQSQFVAGGAQHGFTSVHGFSIHDGEAAAFIAELYNIGEAQTPVDWGTTLFDTANAYYNGGDDVTEHIADAADAVPHLTPFTVGAPGGGGSGFPNCAAQPGTGRDDPTVCVIISGMATPTTHSDSWLNFQDGIHELSHDLGQYTLGTNYEYWYADYAYRGKFYMLARDFGTFFSNKVRFTHQSFTDNLSTFTYDNNGRIPNSFFGTSVLDGVTFTYSRGNDW